MRRRLALLVAATTSVVLLAFLVPLAVLVSRVASSDAIAAATTRSQAVVSAVASGADPAEVAGIAGQLERSGLRVSTTDVTGAATAPRTTVSRTADGDAVLRQPVQVGERVFLVETVVPRAQLREGVVRAWAVLGLLGLVLIVLSLVVADRLARSITRPITDLAGAAERLGRGDLTARVHPDGPEEVREVGTAINLLAGRIGELLTTERESVADLSHRLRTPITVLRLDVESLPAGADRDRLTSSVDELTRQVDGLISEARRPVREGVDARCDAREVVAERVAFWAPLAEDQGRTVALHLPEVPCPVRAAGSDLEAAMDALLGNVIAHTPEGAGLTVAVGRDGHDGVLVVVSDEGPGLPDDSVLRRGESGAGSTGLGLDIARRTAVASGGDLRIGATTSGGARVSMRLGPPTGATADPGVGEG